MKNTLLLSLGILLASGAMLTACSSDDDVLGGLPAEETWTLTVNAAKGGAVAADQSRPLTRALDLVGSTLNAAWKTSESVYVKYEDAWHGVLHPNANSSVAMLTGSLTGFAYLPEVPFELKLRFPRQAGITYEGQTGTLANIASDFDWAIATSTITEIDAEAKIISAANPVTFVNQQAIVKFTLKNGGSDLPVTSLRISATNLKKGEILYGDVTITPASATNVLYAALSGIDGSGRELTLTATTSTGKTYIYKKSGVTFTNGKYYEITSVNMHEVTYPKALSAVTEDYIGSVVGADGNVYPSKDAAKNALTTPVAMIGYVSETGDGLAISLDTEVSMMTQSAAISNASNKTAVTGGTWRLPTSTDWSLMIYGCGAKAAVDNKINFTCFASKLFTAGGGDIMNEFWCSDGSYCLVFNDSELNLTNTMDPSTLCQVRYCLAF